MIGIVVSRADSASVHIGEQLKDRRSWETETDANRPDGAGGGTVYRSGPFELREFDEWHLELDGVAEVFGDDETPDLIVFASRHAGDTGPLLTVHHTGNFGAAEYGGNPRELAAAAPHATATVLRTFAEVAPEQYDIGMECTHHGPTAVGAPSLFVEVGSDEPQWEDPAGAAAAARAILALADGSPTSDRQLVGIGGGHYAPRFARIVRETDWAVGHIAADWSLDELEGPDDPLLEELFVQSQTTYAVTDGEYPAIEAALQESDQPCRFVSETWVRETSGVDLALVDQLETALETVDAGLRFGAPARDLDDMPASLTTVELPEPLLETAQGVDRDAVLTALDETCVGYMTTENGNRAGTKAVVTSAVPTHGATDLPVALVERLATILDAEYGTVTVTETTIQVEKEAFAPELAADAGVPEGPKFGQLASGQPVEVDGRTVTPADVTRVERTAFDLST